MQYLQPPMCQRALQFSVAGIAAAYALLAGVNNIIDYDANFPIVQHVLMMETTYKHAAVIGRSIQSPAVHRAAFMLIIATEITIGLTTAAGALRMYVYRRNPRKFGRARSLAAFGLLLGVALWFGGFLVVGGEWFLMWQSRDYNGQQAAFQYAVAFLLSLLVVLVPEFDEPDGF